MKTITINIQTKKDTVIPCTFAISQQQVFPRIQSYGSGFQWDNGEGLFPQYGNKATGIPRRYNVFLVRSDMEGEIKGNTRQEYAGYEGNPGSIVYRGRNLGELSFFVTPKRDWPTGYYFGTIGLHADIQAQIEKPIADFIRKNEKALKRETIKKAKENMQKSIEAMKRAITKLEIEAKEAISNASK